MNQKIIQVKKNDILDFFILPPSIKELKNRLIKRGRDNKQDINLRLSYAIKEIEHYNEYSYVLINQNIIETVNDIMHIIKSDSIIKKNKTLTAKKIKSLINIQNFIVMEIFISFVNYSFI